MMRSPRAPAHGGRHRGDGRRRRVTAGPSEIRRQRVERGLLPSRHAPALADGGRLARRIPMTSRILVLCCALALAATPAAAQPANPILFVTQVPVGGFTALTSTFGNHLASMQEAPRGGDLVLRYANG